MHKLRDRVVPYRTVARIKRSPLSGASVAVAGASNLLAHPQLNPPKLAHADVFAVFGDLVFDSLADGHAVV